MSAPPTAAAGNSAGPPAWAVYLFVGCLVVLAFGVLVIPLGDPDVYIHLRDGRYWVESGLHVDKDPFTFTASDKPIEKQEWLFRVLLYGLWKIGGYNSLIAFKAAVMTTAFFLLGLLVYHRWPNLGVVGLFAAVALVTPDVMFYGERPYIFTYCLLPLAYLLLHAYQQAPLAEEAAAGKKLWWIPALTVPWANLHPGFLIVLVFLGVFWLENAVATLGARNPLAQRRVWRLGAIGVATFLAGAVNPSGFAIYGFVLNITSSKIHMMTVKEWLPPTFGYYYSFFLILGVAWAAQLLAWSRKTRLADVLLLAGFSYLAVRSRRNIPLFLIAVLPPLAGNLRCLWEKWFPGKHLSLRQRRNGLLLGGAVALAFLAWLAATSGWVLRWGQLPNRYPSNGLAWLESHHFQGRLLTPFAWGGYVGWMTRGRVKVFMDGRLPLFGVKTYLDFHKITFGDPKECLALLDRYQVQGILETPDSNINLFIRLSESPDWALVYWDHVSQFYVRCDGPNRELCERYAYRAVAPWKPAEYILDMHHPELALRELRRAEREAPHSYQPFHLEGVLLLEIQGPAEETRRALQKSVELDPI